MSDQEVWARDVFWAEESPAPLPIEAGPTPPPGTRILVAGRPDPAHLDLPNLEILIVPYAGVPESTARELGARPHLRGYSLHFNAAPVAELAVGLLLAAARRIVEADAAMRKGIWLGRQAEGAGFHLAGSRATLLGRGAIGQALLPMLAGLGIEARLIGRGNLSELGTALAESESLLVSCPLTPETRGLIGEPELRRMRAPRLVVNVGRGPVIQPEPLYRGLKDGWIRAAGLDVWHRYPRGDEPTWPADLPFQELTNVVMSPHRASHVTVAEELRGRALQELLIRLAAGDPPPPIRPDLGY